MNQSSPCPEFLHICFRHENIRWTYQISVNPVAPLSLSLDWAIGSDSLPSFIVRNSCSQNVSLTSSLHQSRYVRFPMNHGHSHSLNKTGITWWLFSIRVSAIISSFLHQPLLTKSGERTAIVLRLVDIESAMFSMMKLPGQKSWKSMQTRNS